MGISSKTAQFSATCRKRPPASGADESPSPGLRDSLLKLAGDWARLADDAERDDIACR